MANKSTFVDAVAVKAATYMQIMESSAVDVKNPQLLEAVDQAYDQCIAYLNRDIPNSEFREEHLFVTGHFQPVNIPLISVTSIIGNHDTDTPLVAGTDYEIRGNNIYFLRTDTTAFPTFGHGFSANDSDAIMYRHIDITYAGGWKNPDKCPITSALVQQSVANYRRIPLVGLQNSSGGGPSGAVSVTNMGNRGGLIQETKFILNAHKYSGPVEPWNV